MKPQEREWFEAAKETVYRDGMYLDERRWNEWIELYTPDCVFWLPMWSEEGVLTPSTDTALSYIYYESRKGLEDRIVRFTSRRSPASHPLPRTTHHCTNLLALETPRADEVRLRAAWSTQVLFTRSGEQHVFFGWAEYTVRYARIARKKVVLQNDAIPTMLDVYCI